MKRYSLVCINEDTRKSNAMILLYIAAPFQLLFFTRNGFYYWHISWFQQVHLVLAFCHAAVDFLTESMKIAYSKPIYGKSKIWTNFKIYQTQTILCLTKYYIYCRIIWLPILLAIFYLKIFKNVIGIQGLNRLFLNSFRHCQK